MSLSTRWFLSKNYEGFEGDSASRTKYTPFYQPYQVFRFKKTFSDRVSEPERSSASHAAAVNEKIEGFYEVCKAKGLTGAQCVMIQRQ